MMTPSINFDRINGAALAACPGLLQRLLPNGQLRGREFVVGNLQGDPGESLSINIETGAWSDFADPDRLRGGDPISLYAAIRGLSQGDAAKALADLVGANGNATPTASAKPPRRSDWQPLLPPMERPDDRAFIHPTHGKPSLVTPYPAPDGSHALQFVCRWDGGPKALPLCYGRLNGRVGWAWKHLPKDRPLCGFDQLTGRPDRIRVIVEGEKAMHAARRLLPDQAVITWSGGSNAVAKTDWSAVRDCKVLIWPDADEPGRKAAMAIAAILRAQGCEVRIVDVAGQAEGWDAADAEAEGWTPEQTFGWLRGRLRDPDEVEDEEPPAGDPAAPSTSEPPLPDEQTERDYAPEPPIDEPPRGEPDIGGDTSLESRLSKFLCNDIGNAQRLRERHGRDMRYAVPGGWHAWDGKRWRRDASDIEVRKRAELTARAIFGEAPFLADMTARKERASWAVKSGNTQKQAAMLRQAEPHLDVSIDVLDQHPFLFAAANGTIDLTTGKLGPHRRSDFLTKISPIAFDPHAPCETWQRFLGDVFNADEGLIGFIQRAVGYCLTGSTREEVMFILHGQGSNGKTKFLELLAALLGDYAAQTPTETFMVKEHGGGIPNDIARLKGARFVSAVETESGRRLAESLVKQATGGDRMAARFLYQEHFEFVPAFKLWLATNHKPEIRGTDNAIWRRIRLIPFNTTFKDPPAPAEGEPPATAEGGPYKDKQILEKLKAELPGILAWAVRGALEWQRVGLGTSGAVDEATRGYKDEMDVLGDFIEERCDTAPNYSGGTGVLYKNYLQYCGDATGDRPLSTKAFGMRLKERGFTQARAGGIRVWQGINLKEEFKQNPEQSDGDHDG